MRFSNTYNMDGFLGRIADEDRAPDPLEKDLFRNMKAKRSKINKRDAMRKNKHKLYLKLRKKRRRGGE